MEDAVQTFARTMDQTATKRQTLQALQYVHKVAPEFCSFSDDSLQKTTTLWIQPIDYQIVRRKLSGKEEKPDGSPKPLNVGKTRPAKAGVTLHSLISKVKRTTDLIGKGKSRKVPLSPPAASKKQRTAAKVGGNKRPFHGSNDDDLFPKRKKQKGLRINRNLILTDADYDGGEIIQPTGESPRGLKRLFVQLNAGKRI
uniref:Uncharacterized protein n=1 Tax=Cyclophora tenuis TaxID=216820 RepID=A0A7S1GPP3_CYCTE